MLNWVLYAHNTRTVVMNNGMISSLPIAASVHTPLLLCRHPARTMHTVFFLFFIVIP